ncbi:hypothetical protein CRENBAI_024710 [Crenichthys baileyi]|uniref:Uncharacterized protein n=1 Tax=Crenichthys baileyi TaxID=28760 RepID=A0AAV9RBP4_9TELE
MRPPRHVLHSDPASKPSSLTVGTSQEKDQAAGEERITPWEYLWPAAEKSARQAREEEEHISPQSGIQLPPHHRSLCWAPHTSSAQFGTALHLHHSLPACRLTPSFLFALPPAEDAVPVRTLFLLLWRFGQVPPYPSWRVWPTLLPLAWRPRLRFLVPSLAPVITQCPLVAPGRRMNPLLPLCSLELLYTILLFMPWSPAIRSSRRGTIHRAFHRRNYRCRAIHVCHSHRSPGSPEQTLEVHNQLKYWKAERGCYSSSSLTVEIIEAVCQKIIKGNFLPVSALASEGSADAPAPLEVSQTPLPLPLRVSATPLLLPLRLFRMPQVLLTPLSVSRAML